MMLRKISTTVTLLFFSLHIISAQGLRFNLGMNIGGSQLRHGIRFQDSKLNLHYQSIAATHPEGYTWEQFEEDFDLQYSYLQPRFGFSVHATYRTWPVFFIFEAMSSPSSYEKMAFSGTIALGKNFDVADTDYFVTAFGGYKFVKDNGFGSKTLVNSIGDDFQRELLSQYFAPVNPLGPQKGSLFTVRLGVGQTFGVDDQLSAGIEFTGELDLTDKTVRQARMTNMGLQVYARFALELRRPDRHFYPSPAGGVKK